MRILISDDSTACHIKRTFYNHARTGSSNIFAVFSRITDFIVTYFTIRQCKFRTRSNINSTTSADINTGLASSCSSYIANNFSARHLCIGALSFSK